MNTVLQAIESRRSIRSYEPKQLPRETLLAIINAANHAPSAMNTQPWRFVVVENQSFRKKLVETAVPNCKKFVETLKESFPQRYQFIMKRFEELEDPIYYKAPAIVFVIGSGPGAGDSCPLACENMMLAAHSLDLGSCWVTFGSLVTDNPEIAKELELKPDEKIFGPILLGYTKEKPQPPAKKDPSIKWI